MGPMPELPDTIEVEIVEVGQYATETPALDFDYGEVEVQSVEGE